MPLAAGYRLPATNPLPTFIANHGQWNPRARYMLDAGSMRIWFADEGAIYQMPGEQGRSHAVRQRFLGASHVAPYGADRVEATYTWIDDDGTIVSSGSREVGYRSIYPGVSLRYRSDESGVKYDLLVEPGADPSRVRFRYDGAESVAIDSDGGLRVATSVGALEEEAPFSYQVVDGERHAVASRFALTGDTVSFELGEYDRSRALVIDPSLSFSSYLGGASADSGRAVAVDSAGNIYVTGVTRSEDFPSTLGARLDVRSRSDIFVTKLDPTGGAVIYSTYIGGGLFEEPTAIRIASGGRAVVAGTTSSNDFPTTSRALESLYNGGASDGFLLALAPLGNMLFFSTYLGGVSEDHIEDMTIKLNGQIVVAGWTTSNDLPTTLGAMSTVPFGAQDAFVARLSATGDTLKFGTYLGGLGDDRAMALAVTPGGATHVTGWTTSTNYPILRTSPGIVHRGGRDAFVTRFESTDLPDFSTLLGGSGWEEAMAIAVDSSDNTYITGSTASIDFPNSIDGNTGSWFVARLGYTRVIDDPKGVLLYSRRFGGGDGEIGMTIQTDPVGTAYVAAAVGPRANLVAGDGMAIGPRGGMDVGIVSIASDGTLLHGSVVGGTRDDRPWRGSVRTRLGDFYLAGVTASSDFPTSRGAFDRVLNDAGQTDQSDAFVLRFNFFRRPSILATPRRTLATAACDTVLRDSFYVHNVGDSTLSIGPNIPFFSRANPKFTLERPVFADLPIRLAPGDSTLFVVRIAPDPGIPAVDTLVINSNDSLRNPLRVAYRVSRSGPSISVAPQGIVRFRSTAQCGPSRDTSITITNSGDGSASLIAPSFGSSGAYTLVSPSPFPTQLAAGGTIRVTLRFRPTRAGEIRDTLTIGVRECGRPVTIPLVGTGDSVAISIAEDTLRFPSISSCGISSDTVVTIVNSGTASVRLDSLRIADPSFELVSPLPATLASGERRSVRVRFTPPSASGVTTATLRLYGAPCALVESVVLIGERRPKDSLAAVPPHEFPTLSACVGAFIAYDTTIQLHNDGSRTITVELPSVPAPFLVLNPASFPIDVPPGGDVPLVVRYAPLLAGADAGVVTVPYRADECRDTLRVDVRGSREDIDLAVDALDIDMGELGDCEVWRDTTIVVRNLGGVPITVDSAAHTSGDSLYRPTLPFTVDPHSTRQVTLRFSPQQTGPTVETITLYVGPCNDSITFTLRGRKRGAIVGVDEPELRLPEIIACGGRAPIDTFVTIRTGVGSDSVTVASATVVGDAEFGVTFAGGTKLGGGQSLRLPIRFAPGGSRRDYQSTLEIVVEPCGTILRIPLAGRTVEPTLLVEGNDFSAVQIGTRKRGRLVLRNPLPESITVDSIGGIVDPFSIVSVDPPLPITLKPGDSILLDIEFAPVAVGEQGVTPIASLSLPCEQSIVFSIRGEGVRVGEDSVRFCLLGGASGDPGDTVAITLRAESVASLRQLVDIRYLVGFDPEALKLVEVISSIGVLEVDTSNESNGRVSIWQRGVLSTSSRQMELRFQLLNGRDRGRIWLIGDSVVGSGLVVALCDDTAKVSIETCIIGVRFGRYANKLEPIRPNPAGSIVELDYQQLESVRATLRIFDMTGREVMRPLDRYLPGGRYTLRFDIGELPAGTYFYQIEAGAYREARMMTVVR